MSRILLNEDQSRALSEILAAFQPGERYLLTGNAGTGKTTLMREVARAAIKSGRRVVLSAPTHKAVAVLFRNMLAAGLPVPCRTIQSLLQLRPVVVADRQVYERIENAEPVMEDLVIIDECSMLSREMMQHIKRYLPRSFVLLVGDPAQLPPVGEQESESFKTPGRSHLSTIVRQAANNPLLAAATALRKQQGGPIDWTWLREAKAPPLGVYMPGRKVEAWMRKGFTSDDFNQDPDSFRYLAWTRQRVAAVNNAVRAWRYGRNIPSPFMVGERAMMTAPLIQNGGIVIGNNEEVTVARIDRGVFRWKFKAGGGHDAWQIEVDCWNVQLLRDDGMVVEAPLPADKHAMTRIDARLRDEAADHRLRWRERHDMQSATAQMQSIYALTVHRAQGSTFGVAFIDIHDIAQRSADNPLECQQLLYVAVTRPTRCAVLAGEP